MTPPTYPLFTGFEPCATTDPELFFPDKGLPGGIHTSKLRTMCESHCLMRAACLDWAVWNVDEGFWGGKTPKERRVIRRALGISKITSRHLAA